MTLTKNILIGIVCSIVVSAFLMVSTSVIVGAYPSRWLLRATWFISICIGALIGNMYTDDHDEVMFKELFDNIKKIEFK